MKRETILMLGESNNGGFNSLTPPQVYPNAANIFVCRTGPVIQPASDPLINVPGFGFAVGPGMGCADEYITRRGDPDLQVCLMVGVGLHAADWQLGQNAFEITSSYADWLAYNWGPVVGIIYTQGVNDAIAGGATANDWSINTQTVFRNFRAHLGGTVPIVINTLPAQPQYLSVPSWPSVQRAIERLPQTVEKLAVVDATGLAVNDPVNDPYHFTAASAVTLGRRDAVALLQLQG